jgi:hypothetical protein
MRPGLLACMAKTPSFTEYLTLERRSSPLFFTIVFSTTREIWLGFNQKATTRKQKIPTVDMRTMVIPKNIKTVR